MAAWLGPLQPFAREELSPERRSGARACFDPAAGALAMLDRHVVGREDLSRQIWGLMALTLWFDR